MAYLQTYYKHPDGGYARSKGLRLFKSWLWYQLAQHFEIWTYSPDANSRRALRMTVFPSVEKSRWFLRIGWSWMFWIHKFNDHRILVWEKGEQPGLEKFLADIGVESGW